MRLQDKIALITGSGSGIGEATAKTFAREGATVQEIANVTLFLASDEASFVTGAFFVADGGLWAHSGMPSLSGQGPEW